MKTLKSTSGKKGVNISKENKKFVACYVQYFNEGDLIREQLIEMKIYNSEKMAVKWANKQLN